MMRTAQTNLMEPDVIPKVRVTIQLGVPSIRGTPALCVAPKDVDDPVLDLFRDLDEVHVITTSSWTLDLQFIAVVLVEPLQALYQEEVDRKP